MKKEIIYLNEIKHKYTKEIVCPYCGYEYMDSWEMVKPEEGEDIVCENCEKKFYARSDMDITYITSKE